MPQFHETPMGLKFFQVDLPRLLTVLETGLPQSEHY